MTCSGDFLQKDVLYKSTINVFSVDTLNFINNQDTQIEFKLTKRKQSFISFFLTLLALILIVTALTVFLGFTCFIKNRNRSTRYYIDKTYVGDRNKLDIPQD